MIKSIAALTASMFAVTVYAADAKQAGGTTKPPAPAASRPAQKAESPKLEHIGTHKAAASAPR
jgi:hypothetical protein